MTNPTVAPIEDRFWRKVKKTKACWIWTGATNHGGYGLLRPGRPGGGGYVRAHRVSWEIHRGPVPDGLCVLHDCPGGQDNPACVNPDHLWLGTRVDNHRDRDAKGHSPSGVKNGQAKLTQREVLAIRRDLAAGVTGRVLSSRHGVAEAHISRIKNRSKWKHV